jgi:transposase InsO family protein
LLEEQRPDGLWPAASTAGDILRRHGLVRPRRRRRPIDHPGKPTTSAQASNELWTADFKGEFRVGDGTYCYPLTVADSWSRYLLGCRALPSTAHDGVQPVFERLFRDFGLPAAIRTDNGSPFASTALGRLSRLSVWWLKLGIRPELIEPASPQQNGSHERMHKTLKDETTRPPERTLRVQQRRFEFFRWEYNEQHPHEALGMIPPSRLYEPSPRPYPRRLAPIEYPAHYQVRRVARNGGVRWKTRWLNVSSVLVEEHVGFEEIADGIWSLYFGPLLLGRFDERELKLYGPRCP